MDYILPCWQDWIKNIFGGIRKITVVLSIIYGLLWEKCCLKAAKTQPWALPFCVWQSVSVTSWTRLSEMYAYYILSCILHYNPTFFLFLTGQEQTGTAAPWRGPIWSSKVLWCITVNRATPTVVLGELALVVSPTEKPGIILMQVWVHGTARDFSPRVSF